VLLLVLALLAAAACDRTSKAKETSPARAADAGNPKNNPAPAYSPVPTLPATVAATSTPASVVTADSTGVTSVPSMGLVADNSRCFVCHINYQDEKMVVKHAAKNIGCELCHGTCDDHCNDENNITAPDKFYTREEGNKLCLACHDPKNMNQVIHKNILAGTFERKYCGDCHGDHRLPNRTRHWDPKTRQVIMANK
jgi:hypothetical protein